MDDLSFTAPKKSSTVPWSIAGGASLLAVGVLVLGVIPGQSRQSELEQRIHQLNEELKTSHSESLQQKQQLASLQAERDKLSTDLTTTRENLNSAIKEKEAAIRELQEAQRDLSETLDDEIAAGDVLIKEQRGQLVVDVSDKLLFDKGAADINERGQELLGEVAKSIRRLPPKLRFQVGGHTDSQRVVSPDLVERFPTNWELSTARASNVVRYLQETGKVPGNKLIASGFAQYRPVSSNATERGRQKNRRIEIIIVMPEE